MADVRHLLSKLSPKHVLAGAPEAYVNGFVSAASNVYPADCIHQILQEKFFIPEDSHFDLDVYLENAVELSVQNHLMRERQVKSFARDKRVNPPKNVDAYYEIGAIRVSLEIKCPVELEPSEDAYVISMGGRVSNYREKFDRLKSLIGSDPKKSVELFKNKDNTLKDFLTLAHQKFSPSSGVDDLNAVFIACGDAGNVQQWYFYLYETGGLFTDAPICPSCEYGLVDVVILSNLKYCHACAPDTHDWTLRNVFVLPFVNPHHRASAVSESILGGLAVFNHHLKRFNDFSPKLDAGEYLKVIHYVVHELKPEERQRYFPVKSQK